MAHNSQVVRAKENLKLNLCGPSYNYASGTNPQIKALRQSRHWAWGLKVWIVKILLQCILVLQL